MAEKYGTHEKAALIVLALANREVPNAELRNEFGIELSPRGRNKLNENGLVKTRDEKQRYFHTITDAGKEWCERELSYTAPPERTGPLVRAVFQLLRRTAPYIRRRDISLVDILCPAGLEERIRAAYYELSVMEQDWVRLAKLRPKLNGADKDEVDRVLLAMTRTGLVHLSPDSNRKALTDADHAAAIRIGSEDKHLLAIEES